MKNQILINFIKLRIIVGALGEIQSPPWWSSAFLAETSGLFLNHIFTKTYNFAQYQGVKESASRVHDEYTGIGKVYHLFRLPEEIEYDLQALLLSQNVSLNEAFQVVKNSNLLIDELTKIAGEKKISAAGPISVGNVKALSKSITVENIAQYYLGAFTDNSKVYPYFAE